jgi:hypothetical protein
MVQYTLIQSEYFKLMTKQWKKVDLNSDLL